MDILRDPLWQFVGVVIALVTILIPIIQSYRKRKAQRSASVDLHALLSVSARGYEKHKKRKSDGILVANISSDFLNQFPVKIGVLAKHLDSTYTPENFGHSNWLDVFKRLIKEEYFLPTKKVPMKRISFETEVNPGLKLEPHFESTRKLRRSIQGLED